jgi:hypothetical protein
VFLTFECESKLITLDGKPLAYEVEAIVRRGEIRHYTVFLNEAAKFIDVAKLPQSEVDWILDNIHYQAAMQEQDLWEELTNTQDHPANSEFPSSYVRWLNRGGK